jgi:hypothetical protein
MSYEISINSNWGAAIAPSLPGVPCRDVKVVIFAKTDAGWVQHSLVTVPVNAGAANMSLFLDFSGDELLVKARRNIDATVFSVIAIFEFNGENWVKSNTKTPASKKEIPAPIIPFYRNTAQATPFETFRRRVTDMYQLLLGVYKPVA